MDTHYQEWNFICSYGYTRSGVMALVDTFHELRLPVEKSHLGRYNGVMLRHFPPDLTK